MKRQREEDAISLMGSKKQKNSPFKELIKAIKAKGQAEKEKAIQLISQMSTEELNKRDKSSYTALQFAAGWGEEEIFKTLIAKMNQETINTVVQKKHKDTGYTILHCAANGGNKTIFEMLYNLKPANIKVKSLEGTVLDLAAEGGHKDLFEKILEIEPKIINMGGYKDWTLLHAAIVGGNEEICRRVLEQKPEDVKRVYHRHPLLYEAAASEKYNKRIVKILISKMPLKMIEEVLNQNGNPHHRAKEAQQKISEIVADFIVENWSDSEIEPTNFNHEQIKLLKLYQMVDPEVLLKYHSEVLGYKSGKLYLNKVNNYITKHYFELIGICKSLTLDSENPLAIFLSSKEGPDCMSHILSYLSPSLCVVQCDTIENLEGVESDLIGDNSGASNSDV